MNRPSDGADNERIVLAAKAKGIGKARADGNFAGGVGHIVEVAVGVGMGVVDGRRHDPIPNGQHAGDEFYGAGGSDQVTLVTITPEGPRIATIVVSDVFPVEGPPAPRPAE